MNLNYSAMVRQRVESMPAGSVFFIQDFADIAGEDSVRQALCRLARQGTIRRLMNGVFDKPAADPRIGTFPPGSGRSDGRCAGPAPSVGYCPLRPHSP